MIGAAAEGGRRRKKTQFFVQGEAYPAPRIAAISDVRGLWGVEVAGISARAPCEDRKHFLGHAARNVCLFFTTRRVSRRRVVLVRIDAHARCAPDDDGIF